MARHRIAASLSLTAVALLAAIMPVAAQAQANCDWYARTALQQQQDNERLKCGFTGPEWNADMRAHLAWCGTVAPDVWKQQAQKRAQALVGCQAKKK